MLRTGKMEGIGYFTAESMKRITAAHPEHRFLFLFDRPFDEAFVFNSNVTPVLAPPPARHPVLWYIWHQYSLKKVFRKHRPGLFIGTDGYITLGTGIPSLAVMHDINFEHYPKDLPFFNRTYYRHFFPRFAREAKRLAAVSNFTREDVISHYKIDPSKIDVVYNGASEKFIPLDDDVIAATRKKFSGGQPYFLFLGALHQRKNIANLLKAYDEFRKGISSPVKLLLTGARRWWTAEMENAYNGMSFRNDVIFTGRVSDEDIYALCASAFAMTYVSVFEGFGIPIIEAMRCNVPVITSNVTAMPEIAGDAALLCDPFSVESISNAMRRMWTDDNLRMHLKSKGIERAKEFTWERTAVMLWESIEKTMR